MIVDVHTHIFPDKIRVSREQFFSNEAEFKSIYQHSNSKMISYEELIHSMDTNGIDKSVIFGFPWNTQEFATLNNDYIIEAVSKYPDRFIGFSCVNPLSEYALCEVRRCFDNGLKGLGEVAFYNSDITDEIISKLKPFMDILIELDYPFMLHTNEPVGHKYPGKADMCLKNIYNFLKSYPNNKIILAHLGGGIFFYNIMKREVKDILKNVYFDTAAVPFLYDKNIYFEASKYAGESKILFGSDYPLINPSVYLTDIDLHVPSTQLIGQIKGANALAILK